MNGKLSALFTWRGVLCSDESDLTATEQHVSLVLSLHMNERGGSCFPGVSRLAVESKRSRATVQRALRGIEAKGWLRVTAGGGRGHTNDYEATVPAWFTELNSLTTQPILPTNGRVTRPFTETKGLISSPKGPHPEARGRQEDVSTEELRSSADSPSANGEVPDRRTAKRKAPRPRPPDVIWDTLVELFGAEAAGLERGRWNKATQSLKQSGATQDSLRGAAKAWPSVYPGATMTPTAIAANWTILTAKPATQSELSMHEVNAFLEEQEALYGRPQLPEDST